MSDQAMCINPDHLDQLRLIASGLPHISPVKLIGLMVDRWFTLITTGTSHVPRVDFMLDLQDGLGADPFEAVGLMMSLIAHGFMTPDYEGDQLRFRVPMVVVDGGLQ